MNATYTTAELSNDISAEIAGRESDIGNEQSIRTLLDLEMVLVGGGSDGVPVWGPR